MGKERDGDVEMGWVCVQGSPHMCGCVRVYVCVCVRVLASQVAHVTLTPRLLMIACVSHQMLYTACHNGRVKGSPGVGGEGVSRREGAGGGGPSIVSPPFQHPAPLPAFAVPARHLSIVRRRVNACILSLDPPPGPHTEASLEVPTVEVPAQRL